MTFMKSLKIGTALAALMVAGMSVPTSAETLQEAMSQAYTSNPDLRAQRAALRAVDERVAAANLASLPSLNGNLFYQRSSQDTIVGGAIIANDSKSLNRSMQIRLDQPLFQGFQRINNRKEAKAIVKAGRAQLLQIEQNVLLNAVTSYMNVLRGEAIYGLTENNVQVLTRQKEAADARFQVGEITRTDVAQSEARLAGSVSERIAAQANLATARAIYRQVMGTFPGTLEPAPDLPPLPADLEAAWAIATDQNPQIRIAMYNEEAAGHAVNSSKGVLLPRADGFLSTTRFNGTDNQAGSISTGFTTETKSAGVSITIPFFQGGREYSDVRRDKQLRSQRRLETLSASLAVRASTETSWQQYHAAVSSIVSNQAEVDANAIALEGVRQEETVGQRTVLEVLNAEQELLVARVDLVTAERDEYVAGFTLLSSLGQLNAAALDLPVELYDPEENYKNVRYRFFGWGIKDYN